MNSNRRYSQDGVSFDAQRSAGAYRYYVLILLMLLFALNFLDRQIINILADPIKRDLALSDTRLGLLTGTAFGLFYSVLGLPIARLADRNSRVGVMSVALLTWSAFTSVCGFAQSYMQLFVARLGVGVGEAGGTPPAQSLIADYFEPERRATAYAVYNLGLPFGSALGFLCGAYLYSAIGWRGAFLVCGIPGLFLFVVIRLTVRELPRGHVEGLSVDPQNQRPFWETIAELLELRSLRWSMIAGSCAVFVIYVSNAWLPVFFMRLHGLGIRQVGYWLALCVSLGGAVGAFGGGYAADQLKRRFALAEIWVPSVAMLLAFPAFLTVILAQNTNIALLGMFLLYSLAYIWMGPTCAIIQRTAPAQCRALATGLQLFIGNIVGLALGPPLIGFISDTFSSTQGAEGLRTALLFGSSMCLLSSGCYLYASKFLNADLARKKIIH